MHRFLVLAALLLAAPAWSSDARERLEVFADGLQLLRGEFSQYQLDPNGGVIDSASGMLALAAPRLFRWDYLRPYQQSIVADGRNLWMFDPDLDQATVRAQSEVEANSPLTVLVDLSTLDRQFAVEDRGTEAGLSWLRLRSRSEEPEFAYADLGFSESGPARLVMEDLLGQQSVIEFSHWQRNPEPRAAEFEFIVPDGVDVIGDPLPRVDVFPVQD